MSRIITFLLIVISCIGYGQIVPPHTNNFDNLPTDTIGWRHYAISGFDDWEVGTPSKYNFNSAYSSPNAWVTNLDSSYYSNSERALESPYYDLTDTTSHLVLSLYHKGITTGSCFYKFEYSVGSSGTWAVVYDASANKKNWQSTNGFMNLNDLAFKYSAIDIFYLQGQDSVKFRFRYNTTTGSQAGWMIDNFSINTEYYNVIATVGDSINGINKHFTQFTVESNFIFQNQFTNTYYFQSDFYISDDPILDTGDIFLGSVNDNLSGSNSNWTNTFNLPPGLSAGYYYVIYQLDVLDTLVENNENDNISYAVMVIDSIYSPPYIAHFDTSFQSWNNGSDSEPSIWKRGDPNAWHIEDSRTGNNAWYNGEHQVSFNDYLVSPFLDFSTTINPVICFWYKNSREPGFLPTLRLQKAILSSGSVTTPLFPVAYNNIPEQRRYDWDCYCENLSSHNGETSTKLRFYGFGNTTPNSLDQSAIDDIYIGEPLPDVSIEGLKKNRFTSAGLTQDTLNYVIYNSGLSSLISTTTEFYWSTDSILDVGDLLLASNIEPTISDTSFLYKKLIYTKPTNATGKYYIFYKVDALNQVSEMREYDNIGYFEIYQDIPENLPYYNDFENSITGWRHSATLGYDDWEWGTPVGVYIDSALSGTKAFVTNLNGVVDSNSRMHLYTPVFNLTQLQNPVMEFDLLNYYYSVGGYSYWPYNMGNIMYSVNGGETWNILDTTSQSFKRMYYQVYFNDVSGYEMSPKNPSIGDCFFGKKIPGFRNQIDYQGRDYDDNHHYVVDLNFLQNNTQVQFMFVYYNVDAPMEGMLLDDFEIREAEQDLLCTTKRVLMLSSLDKKVKEYITLKNNNNYTTLPTQADIYFSSDSILDASDILVETHVIPELAPYLKYVFNTNINTPINFGSYNYMLISIDPNNNVTESNEVNNIHYLKLNMDTALSFNYPHVYDFNEDEIDGWTWYNDLSGSNHGHRFRHRKIISDNVVNAEDGFWFLDVIDRWTTQSNINNFPHYYLESPPYDFSNHGNIKTQFDFICVGQHSNSGSNVRSGGNMQYSLDGGLTWIVLPSVPSAQNWYNLTSAPSLNGQPAWGHWSMWSNWTQAKYDLSFLSGESYVKFRFHYRSKYAMNPYVNHGFRLDNFQIDADNLVKLPDVTVCDGDSALVFGNYESVAGEYYDSLPSSSDTILVQSLVITQVNSAVQQIADSLYSNASNAYYQWLDCNNNFDTISGASLQSFVPGYNGSFAVQVTQNNCIDTSACYLVSGIGIEEVQPLGIVSIYPNPTKDVINIYSNLVIESVELLDIAGCIIKVEYNESQLNLGSLISGMYLVKIRHEEGVSTFRVIKE